jgi:hypothetical protein
MLFEYAVEPQAIGSSWQNFRYLIEKFGFDRGRLISRFPKKWEREVIEAAQRSGMGDVRLKSLISRLQKAKRGALISRGRAYDPSAGDWLYNAIAQQTIAPFHAIIAEQNPAARPDVLVVDDADDLHPLMASPHTWEVERVGTALATAMQPFLSSAKTVLFVDRFFDLSKDPYKETLKACLDVIHASGVAGARCEIHFCDHDKRPPPELVEREAHKWIRGVLPVGMSIVLFSWKECTGGADFHARYLLTDIGGMNVEAGFSAEGAHQKVQLGLLTFDLAKKWLSAFERDSTVYELVGPVLEVRSDGSVHRI